LLLIKPAEAKPAASASTVRPGASPQPIPGAPAVRKAPVPVPPAVPS
jgi:hypothetical protein